MRMSKNQTANNYLTLSTVATFFSAVTASMLQISQSSNKTNLEIAVNAFWFCSLVFSISSVLSSLLAYMRERALLYVSYHLRRHVPLIFALQISKSPEIPHSGNLLSLVVKWCPFLCLVSSAGAFSVGLCLFVYSSNQVCTLSSSRTNMI